MHTAFYQNFSQYHGYLAVMHGLGIPLSELVSIELCIFLPQCHNVGMLLFQSILTKRINQEENKQRKKSKNKETKKSKLDYHKYLSSTTHLYSIEK